MTGYQEVAPGGRRARLWTPGPALRVKVCGVDSIEVSEASGKLGLAAIGFHFWRHHNLKERWDLLRTVSAATPDEVARVLVTDITDESILARIASQEWIDTLQIQGRIPVEVVSGLARNVCESFGLTLIKSLPPTDSNELGRPAYDLVDQLTPFVSAVLLDSGWRGGQGIPPPWDVCASVVSRARVPVILAGGLNAQNVGSAIETVHPYALDVQSSVEDVLTLPDGTKTRRKNPDKIRAFVTAARNAHDAVAGSPAKPSGG